MPHYAASAPQLITFNSQREAVGNIQRRDDFQSRPSLRNIADRAIDCGAAELNRASHQQTSSSECSMSPLHSASDVASFCLRNRVGQVGAGTKRSLPPSSGMIKP